MAELENNLQVTEGEKASKVSNCCENFHAESATKCVLCRIPICGNCFEMVEHNTICKTCHAKVLVELDSENATEKDIPMAILGGLVGSSLGAFLWAFVTILTGYQIGYAAIGVGFLTGHGVALAVGKRKAFFLQIISGVWATIGCVVGNMVITIYYVTKSVDIEQVKINYFDFKLWNLAFEEYQKDFGFFSLIWIGFAIWFSWRTSAPRETTRHS